MVSSMEYFCSSRWTLGAYPGTTTNAFQYRPIGKNANMSNAYTWNVTIPTTVPAGSAIRKVIPDDMLLVSTNTMATGARYGSIDYTVSAISLKPTSRGQLLWTKSYAAPTGDITRQWGPVDPESRVFTMNDKETMQWLGYDLDSGTLLWGPLGDVRDFNYYPTVGMGGSGPAGFVAYRKLYTGGYGGEFFCYDMKTGALLWEYNNTASAHETPWATTRLSQLRLQMERYICTAANTRPTPHSTRAQEYAASTPQPVKNCGLC